MDRKQADPNLKSSIFKKSQQKLKKIILNINRVIIGLFHTQMFQKSAKFEKRKNS